MHTPAIWIIDFGSQYTQLIARKCREIGLSSIIYTYEHYQDLIEGEQKPACLVLSGGPHSISEDKNDYNPVFKIGVPVLGICYGMQLITHFFKGSVEKGVTGEYGKAVVSQQGAFFSELPQEFKAWMSHFDEVIAAPNGFDVLLKSENGKIAGMYNRDSKIMGLQFHPEVNHTQFGEDILRHFFFHEAKLTPDWEAGAMLEEAIDVVKEKKAGKVLCAFSGGVDSVVAAHVAHQVYGEELYCFFVDNGLLRPQDYQHIKTLQKESKLQIEVIDAKELFLSKLKGISEPEKKRKMIGNTFIEVFDQKVHEFEKSHGFTFTHLLQGTLYPDVIESVSPHGEDGKSVTIKSHHNVGGLPEKMKLSLMEPLRFLFKDEVRAMGEHMGLPHNWLYRHPFPGPGIGVRVLGELDQVAIEKVQRSDQILFEEMKSFRVYEKCWQAFTVLLPVETVGVKGDARAYEQVIAVRMVDSTDGMTATWSEMPWDFLSRVSERITNEVPGVARCVYDITSKPPGTIEWE